MKVHFIGIAGRAMGGLALALARAGHRVTGSDDGAYEPMLSELGAGGLLPTSFAACAVPEDADVIVAGKRVTEDNPELRWVRSRGLLCQTFPQFLAERFLHRSRNAVIAGGVGKTTTTALLTWILEHAGHAPDYLIGGIAHNFETPARLNGSVLTVLEGDEYASGLSDFSPKFLHYRPEVVILTNLLNDHPDLYPEPASLIAAFGRLARLLPPHGLLILGDTDPDTEPLAAMARCPVLRVGRGKDAQREVGEIELTAAGSAFTLEGARFRLPSYGLMNIHNAALASVAASHFGVSYETSAKALELFKGVRDRQEVRHTGECVVVRDKASHPQSLTGLAAALRQRFGARRLVSVIQPRATGGAGWTYQRDLPAALSLFEKVLLTGAYEHKPPSTVAWKDHPFSVEALGNDLRSRGIDVETVPDLETLPQAVGAAARSGDVVLLSLREQFATLGDAVECALRSSTSNPSAAARRGSAGSAEWP